MIDSALSQGSAGVFPNGEAIRLRAWQGEGGEAEGEGVYVVKRLSVKDVQIDIRSIVAVRVNSSLEYILPPALAHALHIETKCGDSLADLPAALPPQA